jgi:hypothetical protein
MGRFFLLFSAHRLAWIALAVVVLAGVFLLFDRRHSSQSPQLVRLHWLWRRFPQKRSTTIPPPANGC